MASATSLPTYTNNKFFFWNGRLTDSLDNSTSDQDFFWDTIPVDENGATITGGFLVAMRNTRRNPNRTELSWVPLGAVNADGLGCTGAIRGLKPSGIDYTTGDSDFVYEFDSGDEIFCAILPQDGELLRSALQGVIATGAVGITIGTDSGNETVTLYRTTGAGTKQGFLRWSTTNDKTEYSNDGSTWNTFDSVTASNLVVVTNNDTTPGTLDTKITTTSGRITHTVTSPAGDERLDFDLAMTASDAEINQALDGISANVTAANLNTLTAGAASDADALHTHGYSGIVGFTAGEDLAKGDTVYIAGATITTLNPDRDNTIDSTNPNTVFNGTTIEASNQVHRALLHFDISAQPASVEKAYLKVVLTSAGTAFSATRRLQVSSLTGAFSETTVTWNNAPGVNADAVTCSYNVRNNYPDGAVIYFDITTMYNSVWSVNNYGLRLWWNDETAGGGGWDVICGSRTASGGSVDYPKLILVTKSGNYGKAFKTSSASNVAGFKGIVTTAVSSGGTASIQLTGVNDDVSGLTAFTLYKAGTSGTLSAATNALDTQVLALSSTQVKLLDKRSEYATDILSTASSIYDLDAHIVTAPAGLILDNQTNTAATSSSTYDQDGWVISIPTDAGVTSRSVGMSSVDIL